MNLGILVTLAVRPNSGFVPLLTTLVIKLDLI